MSAGLVMVLEDESMLREPLAHLLRLRQFEVVTAVSVDSAIELLHTRRPDAAIVDLCLESGSGRDVVVRLPAEVPVIIYSGMPQASGQLERLRPRTRLVEKPCSLTWLIDNLLDMLTRARAVPVSAV